MAIARGKYKLSGIIAKKTQRSTRGVSYPLFTSLSGFEISHREPCQIQGIALHDQHDHHPCVSVQRIDCVCRNDKMQQLQEGRRGEHRGEQEKIMRDSAEKLLLICRRSLDFKAVHSFNVGQFVSIRS